MGFIITTEFWFAVIRATTAVLLTAMGACIVRKAGIVNLALEGTMLITALTGVIASAFSRSLLIGMLFGVAAGVIVSLLLAYFFLSLRADMTVTGIALNLMATGGTVFVLYTITGDRGISSALNSLTYPAVKLPFLRHIPVVGGVLHGVLSGHNLLTYVAFLMVPVVYVFLYKTPYGTRIRAVGENPNAAASVGVNVHRVQTVSLVLCGILTSFGGMFLSMAYLSMFSANMTNGRGFIALAATNMATGNPYGAAAASLVYGFSLSMANNMQNMEFPLELLYMLPYVFIIVVFTVFSYRTRKKNKEPMPF